MTNKRRESITYRFVEDIRHKIIPRACNNILSEFPNNRQEGTTTEDFKER